MILFLALAAALPAIDGTPLGVLAPQSLPERGCAAYLFTSDGKRRFVAYASAETGVLRIVLDGAAAEATRSAQTGSVGYGLAPSTEYKSAGFTATLDMATTERADLSAGAVISQATLRIDRQDQDGVAVPLVGLIGCRT